MYLLGAHTHLDLKYQIYISSIIRICISFIGHNIWTFKGSFTPLWKRAIKFFPWEIFSLILIAQTLLLINVLLEKAIKDMTKKQIDDNFFLRNMVEKDKDGKNIIKTSIFIVFKQILMVLFYFIVDIRVYKYIF